MQVGRAKREESRFRGHAVAVARTLRSVRIARDLTQEQVAAQAQIAVSTLRKIESGRVVEPGFFTMMAIADALGVALQELQATIAVPGDTAAV